jgi:nitrogenase molybdenum-iron protein alpha/beta subunit
MTIAEVKANKEIFDAIKAEVIAEERDRVNAILAFAHLDLKAVIAEIEAGKNPTQTFFAKMQLKALSVQGAANLSEPAEPVTTPAAEAQKTKEALEIEAFKKEVAEVAKRNGFYTA